MNLLDYGHIWILLELCRRDKGAVLPEQSILLSMQILLCKAMGFTQFDDCHHSPSHLVFGTFGFATTLDVHLHIPVGSYFQGLFELLWIHRVGFVQQNVLVFTVRQQLFQAS